MGRMESWLWDLDVRDPDPRTSISVSSLIPPSHSLFAVPHNFPLSPMARPFFLTGPHPCPKRLHLLRTLQSQLPALGTCTFRQRLLLLDKPQTPKDGLSNLPTRFRQTTTLQAAVNFKVQSNYLEKKKKRKEKKAKKERVESVKQVLRGDGEHAPIR